jgi:hypothetical protein
MRTSTRPAASARSNAVRSGPPVWSPGMPESRRNHPWARNSRSWTRWDSRTSVTGAPTPSRHRPAILTITGAPSRRLRHQRSPVVTQTTSPSLTYETGVEYLRPLLRPVQARMANQRLSGQCRGEPSRTRMAGFRSRRAVPSSEPRRAGRATRFTAPIVSSSLVAHRRISRAVVLPTRRAFGPLRMGSWQDGSRPAQCGTHRLDSGLPSACHRTSLREESA